MEANSAPPAETVPNTKSEIRYRQEVSDEVSITTTGGFSRTVRPTRERAYPGLAGPAPQTEVLYRGLAPLFRGRAVVDLGCGVGLGSAILGKEASHVTAIDTSELAMALCTEFAPSAKAVTLDASSVHSLGSFEGTVCIDLLGHVASPIALLRSVEQALTPGGIAVFAEPTATVSQALMAPARRAFSKTFVKALLATSGLRLDRFVTEGYPFMIWTATPQRDDGWKWLVRGIEQSVSDPDEAVAAFGRARESKDTAVLVEAALAEADLFLRLRHGDAACGAYIRAKELAPDDARPLAGLAAIMFEKGDRETALELTQMAIAKDPVELVGRLTFAAIMDRISETRWASCWRTVNALAPDNADWALNFAQAALGGKFAKDAILAIDRLELYPGAVPTALLTAKVELLESVGRKAEAALATRATVSQ